MEPMAPVGGSISSSAWPLRCRHALQDTTLSWLWSCMVRFLCFLINSQDWSAPLKTYNECLQMSERPSCETVIVLSSTASEVRIRTRRLFYMKTDLYLIHTASWDSWEADSETEISM